MASTRGVNGATLCQAIIITNILRVTVGSRIREFQRQIKSILTRGSKGTQVNIIGKKSTEAALIHSDFQGVVPLKVTVLHASVNRVFKYDN